MAFETGGMADKLGNRYEGQWVVKQLLRLLNEEIQSVTVELIGPDEQGVDLLIVKTDGTRQLQQCKARCGSRESWTIAVLKEKGILGHLYKHLSLDSKQEFALISPIPFQNFADICGSARNSNNKPKDFYQYQIQEVGKERRRIFHNFCDAVELDIRKDSDLTKAFELVQHTYFELFPDNQDTWSNLLTWSNFLLTGKPETVISLLLTYVEIEENFRKPIYSDDLRRFLEKKHDIHPKRLEHDTRIAPAIEELQKQFSESICPGLITGRVISKMETSQIIEIIEKGQDVVVHSMAGNGKSGVLYELTRYLKSKNIPYLPIRLDRRIPCKNAKIYGEEMGLPESPASSLAGLAANRQSVLILDQLDAIRWTAAHSAIAMDVVKELIRQVRLLRNAGKRIVVVFACRTFDLENDPEIKNLIASAGKQDFVKIKIREFTEEQLKEVIGTDIGVLIESQKKILRNPLNLAIWMQLRNDGMKPDFRSSTGLMRRFWENRRQILEQRVGINHKQIEAFLYPLVDYMENKGEVSAPASMAMQELSVRDALISYGILQQGQARISFCHQRYLDYLIAERLLLKIYDGSGTVESWLGPLEKQSLFRREQLRQVMTLLADESPLDFFSAVKEILESANVRFHLKHLVLEMIGQLDEVKKDTGNYCLALLSQAYWKDHLFETVFLGHQSWVSFLLNAGKISEWLYASEESFSNLALWLLRSVAEHIPDQVTLILNPAVEKGGDWPSRVLNSICWKESDDSEQMFELRLQLARIGHVKDYVNWEVICSKHPLRAIRLIEAVFSTWEVEKKEQTKRKKSRLERWYDRDLEALNGVVKSYPTQTWDYLMPHVERLTSFRIENYEPRLEKWQEGHFENKETDICRGVVELLILSGQAMGANQPEELIARTALLEKSISHVVQEIILAAFTCISTAYADIAIKWLLTDSTRFRLGSGYYEPEWLPAVRLVTAISPHCSEGLFKQLEESILHYHAPEERRDAEYYLNGWKEGYFGHYWGTTQFFLLPALDATRIKKSTRNLISVLERKFEHYSRERFLRHGSHSGGWIGSKLDSNLEKLSDNAWLRIVNCEKVTETDNHKWIQINSNSVITTSVKQFARSLSRIAKRYPERIGRLGLRFPDNVHSSYISAIIDSFGKLQPDEEIPASEREAWQAATIKTIENLLEKYQAYSDREVAMSFCRLMEARACENWSNKTIARLLSYACSHKDLEIGKLNINCDKTSEEATIGILYQNTINCVRGVAASAIGQILWEHVDALSQVETAIEILVRDPHPVVRMAAIKAIEPVLNINRNKAVQWFCETCRDDMRVAASPRALRFFNHIIPSHIDQASLIIKEMIASPLDEVAIEGSKQVAARWLFHGFFEKELNDCRKGTIAQRKGVASAAASLLKDRNYSKKCLELLQDFNNDPNKEVRDELRGKILDSQLANNPEYVMFSKNYIKSLAFADDPDSFIMGLQDFTGSLIPLAEAIFDICMEFSTTLKEKTHDFSSSYFHLPSEISTLLLRLYEQAQGMGNPQIYNQCLDFWDLLFENRVGRSIELTKAIDQ
ncbi:MAG: hypothetical protein CVV41_22415 [Candidatus Riflebacteria bacterium HGW-Riflebacteria-1]|jgi:hypothetical protein|nr:MAG: hypothetical protein CVV41_22415 [Candidatus Riflebacteria bacterium HGW-Riflebacteria-1]